MESPVIIQDELTKKVLTNNKISLIRKPMNSFRKIPICSKRNTTADLFEKKTLARSDSAESLSREISDPTETHHETEKSFEYEAEVEPEIDYDNGFSLGRFLSDTRTKSGINDLTLILCQNDVRFGITESQTFSSKMHPLQISSSYIYDIPLEESIPSELILNNNIRDEDRWVSINRSLDEKIADLGNTQSYMTREFKRNNITDSEEFSNFERLNSADDEQLNNQTSCQEFDNKIFSELEACSSSRAERSLNFFKVPVELCKDMQRNKISHSNMNITYNTFKSVSLDKNSLNIS